MCGTWRADVDSESDRECRVSLSLVLEWWEGAGVAFRAFVARQSSSRDESGVSEDVEGDSCCERAWELIVAPHV